MATVASITQSPRDPGGSAMSYVWSVCTAMIQNHFQSSNTHLPFSVPCKFSSDSAIVLLLLEVCDANCTYSTISE